jgi:hypothetical protein
MIPPMKPVRWLTLALMVLAMVGCGRKTNSAAGNEATLTDLNRALALMKMENGRCPATVSALTNFPIMHGKTLPVPPPGKKLAIDPATQQVVLINQ